MIGMARFLRLMKVSPGPVLALLDFLGKETARHIGFLVNPVGRNVSHEKTVTDHGCFPEMEFT